jgi:hypothetical protein
MAQAFAVPRVALPFLPDNSPASCPIALSELVRYVRTHTDEGRRINPSDLTFVRTAQIEECRYWMWRYRASGTRWYALVMEDAAGPWMCCHRAEDRSAPEDVLLDDYRTAVLDS